MTVIPRRPKVLERQVTVGSEAKRACVRQSAAARPPAGHDGARKRELVGVRAVHSSGQRGVSIGFSVGPRAE